MQNNFRKKNYINRLRNIDTCKHPKMKKGKWLQKRKRERERKA